VSRWEEGTPWFGASELIDEQTCECCDNALAVRGDRVLLAFRDQVLDEDDPAAAPIRDSAVRASEDGGVTWSDDAVRLGEEDWAFDQCPEAGPDLTFTSDDDLHGAYYTGVEGAPGVYHAHSTDGGATFMAHALASDEEFFPPAAIDVAAAGAGSLIAWDDHRTDTTKISFASVDEAGDASVREAAFSGETPSVAAMDSHLLLAWRGEDGIMLAASGAHDHGSADAAGGSDKPDADVTFTATVAGGKVDGGPQAWRVEQGQTVAVTVTSDEPEELHVHGYDLYRDIPRGGTATITFTADTTGSFEVELEESKQLLGMLEVR
jgi:hypothetical protein